MDLMIFSYYVIEFEDFIIIWLFILCFSINFYHVEYFARASRAIFNKHDTLSSQKYIRTTEYTLAGELLTKIYNTCPFIYENI
jgi:hypothetical protein